MPSKINKFTPPARMFGDTAKDGAERFTPPPAPESVKSFGQLEAGPYVGLIDKATLKQWHESFAKLQNRVAFLERLLKDANNHIAELHTYIDTVVHGTLPDYIQGRLTAFDNTFYGNDVGLVQMIDDINSRLSVIEQYIMPSEETGNEEGVQTYDETAHSTGE